MSRLVSLCLLSCWSLGVLAADKGFDVDVVLKSTTTMTQQRIKLPSGDETAMEAHVVTINPRSEVGRHAHPYPVVTYVLEGTVLVVSDDGTEASYGPGEAFIEDAGTWVNNKNPGDTPARFLAVLAAEAGTPTVTFPE